MLVGSFCLLRQFSIESRKAGKFASGGSWRKRRFDGAPRPRHSPQETRLIKRLAWQWFIGEGPSCSLPDLARRLGVSQTYCQKLMRQFRSNPLSDLDLVLRGYGGLSISASGQLQEPRIRILTTFEELREAQEETKRMRERGYLHARSMGASRWNTQRQET